MMIFPVLLWMEDDGCEILHHQKDGWNPINNGMFTIYQLGIWISLAHPQ